MTLTALSYDIAHIILSLLSANDIASVRLVSKGCKSFADILFHATITLHDLPGKRQEEEQQEARVQALREKTAHYVRRLYNPTDELSELVKSLRFQDEAAFGDGNGRLANYVIWILRRLKRLYSFYWCTITPIPETAISELETLFPACRLFVENHRRVVPSHGPPLDMRLLSSPLLHSLTSTLLWFVVEPHLFKRQVGPPNVRSTLASFARILNETPRLAHLDLDFSERRFVSYKEPLGELLESQQTLQLPVSTSDRSPPLESLVMSCLDYDFSPEHCIVLASYLTPLTLRKLHLRHDGPSNFISALKDRVPNLRWLGIDKVPTSSDRAVCDLIESIKGLHTLQLSCVAQLSNIFSAITAHAASLKHLSIRAEELTISARYFPLLQYPQLVALSSDFPCLTSLALDMHVPSLSDYAHWKPASLSLFGAFPRLKTLHFRFAMPYIYAGHSLESHLRELFCALVDETPQTRLVILKAEMTLITTSLTMGQDHVFYPEDYVMLKEWVTLLRAERDGANEMRNGGLVCEVVKEEKFFEAPEREWDPFD